METIETIEDLKDYLIDVTDYNEEDVEKMTSFDLVDAYLYWNGIINYTDDIINVVFAAFGINVNELDN